MGRDRISPQMVFADEQGNIFDHPHLKMLCRKGRSLELPRPDELIPLPEGSDFFLLPKRRAIGLDPDTGLVECLEENAVAAFVCPGYTISSTAAYQTNQIAPKLPLFAYGALGFVQGRFYVCAKRVDLDTRQVFLGIPQKRIQDGAHRWLKTFPKNRLVTHLAKCALTYCCPAARNLALGRFEAPIPTAQACNARCIGCISHQPEDSGFPATQNRINFRPTAKEICEIMDEHARHERRPIFSFGQGCEGDPLTEAETIIKAVSQFRAHHGPGTVNVNTNAGIPSAIVPLAQAGLSSIRVSLNSARIGVYESYYRPQSYRFSDVVASMELAKQNNLFVSLNYLFFPGINDTEEELEALSLLIDQTHLDFIQMRNLNLDPDVYLGLMPEPGTCMGLSHFIKRLKKNHPWLRFGYFNPYLGQ